MAQDDVGAAIGQMFPGMEVRSRKSRLTQVVYNAVSPSGHLRIETSSGGRVSYVQVHLTLGGGKIAVTAPQSADGLRNLRDNLLALWADLGIAVGYMGVVLGGEGAPGGEADGAPDLGREGPEGAPVGVLPLAPLPEDVGGVVARDDRDGAVPQLAGQVGPGEEG